MWRNFDRARPGRPPLRPPIRSRYGSASAWSASRRPASSSTVRYSRLSPNDRRLLPLLRLRAAPLEPALEALDVAGDDEALERVRRLRELGGVGDVRPRGVERRRAPRPPAARSALCLLDEPVALELPEVVGARCRSSRRPRRPASDAVIGPSRRSSPSSLTRSGCASARSARGSRELDRRASWKGIFAKKPLHVQRAGDALAATPARRQRPISAATPCMPTRRGHDVEHALAGAPGDVRLELGPVVDQVAAGARRAERLLRAARTTARAARPPRRRRSARTRAPPRPARRRTRRRARMRP